MYEDVDFLVWFGLVFNSFKAIVRNFMFWTEIHLLFVEITLPWTKMNSC